MNTMFTKRGWFAKSERVAIVHHYPPSLPACELHRSNYRVNSQKLQCKLPI